MTSTRTEERTSRQTATTSRTAGKKARPGKSPEQRAAEATALRCLFGDGAATGSGWQQNWRKTRSFCPSCGRAFA